MLKLPVVPCKQPVIEFWLLPVSLELGVVCVVVVVVCVVDVLLLLGWLDCG